MPFDNPTPVIDDEVEVVYSDETGGEDENNMSGADSLPDEDSMDDADDVGGENDAAASGDDDGEDGESAGVLPSEDGEEPTDAEYKSYSTSVKKRIKREIKLRRGLAQELASTTQQRDSLFAVAKNGEAGFFKLQKDHDALQEQYYGLLAVSLENAIEQKTSELQAARDQGNTAIELQAQAAIEELRFNKRQLTDVAGTFKTQKAQRDQMQPQLQQMQFPPPQNGVPPLALQWVSRNAWIKEPKYAPHREFIKQIDAKLMANGFNPNTEIYYSELDKELRKAFPSVPRSVASGARRGATPVAPASLRSGANSASKGKRIVLTQADMQTMRKFNLDPANKQHVVAFARERAKSKTSA